MNAARCKCGVVENAKFMKPLSKPFIYKKEDGIHRIWMQCHACHEEVGKE